MSERREERKEQVREEEREEERVREERREGVYMYMDVTQEKALKYRKEAYTIHKSSITQDTPLPDSHFL